MGFNYGDMMNQAKDHAETDGKSSGRVEGDEFEASSGGGAVKDYCKW